MKPCFLTADYSLFLYPYVYCLGSVTEKYVKWITTLNFRGTYGIQGNAVTLSLIHI